MNKRKYKGIIFDFNGTLFFDSDKHEIAWKKFSTDARGYPFSDEEMRQSVHGRTNRSILEYLLEREIPDDVLTYFVTKKEDFYKHICLQDKKNLKLVDGAIELFNQLKRRQIPMTIATASEITNLKFFVDQFGLDRWFDFGRIVYDDYKIKGKPAPDMFLKAVKNLGLAPADCVIFEDSESGVAAAKAADIGGIIMIDPLDNESKFHDKPDVDLVLPDFRKFDVSNYF